MARTARASRIGLCAAAVLMAPAAAAAQAGGEGGAPSHDNRLHIDLQPIGVTVGFARTLRSGRAIGGEIGVGGNFLEYMLVGGRHFAEDGGIAYEDRDNATDPVVFEILSVGVFTRHAGTRRWDLDTGLRASAFLHFDSSDDDPGGGVFGGAYATALYGWRNVKFGPRLMIGAFSEGRGTTEFGVHIVFLIGRLTFAW